MAILVLLVGTVYPLTASATVGLSPFGGRVLATLPCYGVIWLIVMGPPFNGGLLYSAVGTMTYSNLNITTPGVLSLGEYLPSTSYCWVYDGGGDWHRRPGNPGGVMTQVGTSLAF